MEVRPKETERAGAGGSDLEKGSRSENVERDVSGTLAGGRGGVGGLLFLMVDATSSSHAYQAEQLG